MAGEELAKYHEEPKSRELITDEVDAAWAAFRFLANKPHNLGLAFGLMYEYKVKRTQYNSFYYANAVIRVAFGTEFSPNDQRKADKHFAILLETLNVDVEAMSLNDIKFALASILKKELENVSWALASRQF